MKGLKRFVAVILAVTVGVLCLALCASAVGMADASESREVVLINIGSRQEEISDFVTEFPAMLSLAAPKAEPPVVEPAVAVGYDEIPLFTQEEYPRALYGSETLDICGSSITALAMVASYLTGYEYLPDEMARCFAGKADTDAGRVLFAANALGLPFETSDKWQEILAGLKEGKCAILQVNKDSLFARDEHYIVLKGIAEDGKILIHDPCAADYENEALKAGLTYGFADGDISIGACYGWIFDKSKVPADIARYTETAKTTEENTAAGMEAGTAGNRYDSLKLTLAEKQLLARVVHVNGYGECAEGQQALIEVILNRLLSAEFPNDLKDIVYGENGLCEVSFLNEAEVGRVEYLAVERAVGGPYLLAENVTEFSYICHR